MSKTTDISTQIDKYLNGELDGRAMHQFERLAQDDPFIMDALDGYAVKGSNKQASLDELRARLKQRVNAPAARIVRFRNLSIAASLVAVLLVFAGIWVFTNKTVETKEKLANTELVESIEPKLVPPVTDTVVEEVNDEKVASIEHPPVAAQRIESSGNANEAFTAKPDAETHAAEDVKLPDDASSLEELIAVKYDKDLRDGNIKKSLVPVVDSASIALSSSSVIAAKEQAKVPAFETKTANNISGIITGAGGPLPGARVRVKGTDISSITDMRGRFKLPVEPPKSLVLDIDMIGYLNKQVKVNTKDSVVIAMKPRQAQTGGVITGYGEAQCCWDVYEKYLKDNAISPDGKSGTVKLSFKVNPDNSLSEFKILKSLSEVADNKAIEIIKNGPPWVHDPSGKPKKVMLRVKFSTPN